MPTGPRKPLGLFSPPFVADLAEDQLVYIAGEECGAEPATCATEERDPGPGNWSKDYDVDLVYVLPSTYVTRSFYMSIK